MNRICVIFTGGTIGSTAKDGIVGPDKATGRLLLSMYREAFGDTVRFEVESPFTILSENIAQDNWLALLACIEQRTDSFDGIIVTHGSDTLAYTAAFLHFALADRLHIPVVLVSAMKPLQHPESNGLRNFAAAVSFIENGRAGVFAACQNEGQPVTLYNGLSLMQARQTDGFFDALYAAAAGQIENGAFVPNPGFRPAAPLALPRPLSLQPRVLYLRAHALQDFSVYCFAEPPKAIVFELYHSGTVCTADGGFAAFCARAAAADVDVILVSAGDAVYKGMEDIFSLPNVLALPELTVEAALVKTMLAYGIFSVHAERRAFLQSGNPPRKGE